MHDNRSRHLEAEVGCGEAVTKASELAAQVPTKRVLSQAENVNTPYRIYPLPMTQHLGPGYEGFCMHVHKHI